MSAQVNSGKFCALVLGASGEVGKELVKELEKNDFCHKIIVITRRQLNLNNGKIVEKIVDFDNLLNFKDAFEGSQVAYCCLGTTRGKSGAEGFVKVDRDYVKQSAQILRDFGCPYFHLVTGVGANKNSRFLYPKTKGEVEEAVTEMKFPLLQIYRPSLLLCQRQESRPLEQISQILIRGFDWRNKLSVRTDTVAAAMVANTVKNFPLLDNSPKVEIFSNADILRLGLD